MSAEQDSADDAVEPNASSGAGVPDETDDETDDQTDGETADEPIEPGKRMRARRAALGLLIRAFPGRTALMALVAILIGAAPAVLAYLIGRLVADLPPAVRGGFDSPAGRTLVLVLVGVGAVLLAQEVLSALSSVLNTDLYRRFDEYLLGRVMDTTMAVPRLDGFEDPDFAALTDRAARVARYGPGELVSGLGLQWQRRAEGVASAILVATIWPIAALVLVVLWAVLARFLRADSYRANPFWAAPLRRAMYLKRLATMPDAAKEQRIFGLTGWLVDRFGREWSQVMAALWASRKVGYRTMGILIPLVLLANLAILLYAAWAALAGHLGVAAVTVLVQGVFGLVALGSQDGDIWIENGAIPAPDVIAHERAAHERTPGVRPGNPPAKPTKGLPSKAIRFENVGFSYAGRDPVYESFDLEIEAGSSLAIVGLNGAGKTTLVKLLAGLEVPTSGRITVDGVPLDELDLDGWHRQVAAIFQDFVRYQLPARDNIGFGAVETLHSKGIDDRVRGAAERAGAVDLLDRLPSGLDTVLSRRHEGGVDLSGGQWQRVALARAMAAVSSGARVLVLDEPTAHLDVRAEADIYDRFLDMTEGLTSVVISHRFSTVRRADRIIVLDGGRVTEDGSHDELVAAGGRYAELFRTQASRYREVGVGGETESGLEREVEDE